MLLRSTPGYAGFRERLGRSNHVLITTLIGLEGVRTGAVTKSEEFHAAWHPSSLEDSARRARRFVRDAMLNHIVDSLASYLRSLRTEACLEAVPRLAAQSDRSAKTRLDALVTDLTAPLDVPLALTHLAIQWRNRRLHVDADNSLEQQYVGALRKSREQLVRQYSGLEVDELLMRFEMRESPRFKEVASLVKATLDFVQQADSAVVAKLDPTRVAREMLTDTLRNRMQRDRRRAGQQWGNVADERRRRIVGILRSGGFIESPSIDRAVPLPNSFIDDLATLTYSEVCEHLGIVAPSS